MSDGKTRAKRPRKTPGWTFSLGGLVGLALGVPLIVCALLVLAATGVADPEDVTLRRAVRLTAIFAGFPLFLSSGGVARLVAHRLQERGAKALGRAIAIGAGAMAVAGMAAMVLAAVPIGGMPEIPGRWGIVCGAGALAGAVTGVAIGALVGMRTRRHSDALPAAAAEAEAAAEAAKAPGEEAATT